MTGSFEHRFLGKKVKTLVKLSGFVIEHMHNTTLVRDTFTKSLSNWESPKFSIDFIFDLHVKCEST